MHKLRLLKLLEPGSHQSHYGKFQYLLNLYINLLLDYLKRR